MKKNFSIVRVVGGLALALLILLVLSGWFLPLFGFAWFMFMSNPLAPHVVGGAILLYFVLRVIFSGIHNMPLYGLLWVFSAILWSTYGLYENSMQATDPGASIRIDMLVISPLLFGLPVLAIMYDRRQMKKRKANVHD